MKARLFLIIVFLSFFQEFDKEELLECIRKLVEVEKDWVPYSTSASLYIRPTLIGTEVGEKYFFFLLLGWVKGYPLFLELSRVETQV